MLYTKLTQRAMQICFEAHRDQVDKGGMPYVFHPFHLAEQMETEEETCTALLHDVMEDTAWTYEQLAAEGFPSSVMEALALLTHDDNTPYLDYVERLSGNRIAARVKLADLRHNSTAGRLPVIGEKERKRMRKYLRAQAILTRGAADLVDSRINMPSYCHPGAGRTGPQIWAEFSGRQAGAGIPGALSPSGGSGRTGRFCCTGRSMVQ